MSNNKLAVKSVSGKFVPPVFSTVPSLSSSPKVDGDIEQARITLVKEGLYNVTQNVQMQGRHEKHDPNNIKPLDSQRDVKISWAMKCLRARKGWDLGAAGVICVVKDIKDGTLYAWDGLGRLMQAQIMGIPLVDCWVSDGTKEQAAEHFVYNQKDGKRNLNNETIFCNEAFAGDKETLIHVDNLRSLNLAIRGATDVVYPIGSTDPTIKVKALTDSLIISNQQIFIIRLARDMIIKAYPTTNFIPKEFLCGMVHLLIHAPESQKNGTNTALQNYLNFKSQEFDKIKNLGSWFKEEGGNKHNLEAESVAEGILAGLRKSSFVNTYNKNKLPTTFF